MFKKQKSQGPKSRINLYYKLKIWNEIDDQQLLWEMSPSLMPWFFARGKLGSQFPRITIINQQMQQLLYVCYASSCKDLSDEPLEHTRKYKTSSCSQRAYNPIGEKGDEMQNYSTVFKTVCAKCAKTTVPDHAQRGNDQYKPVRAWISLEAMSWGGFKEM